MNHLRAGKSSCLALSATLAVLLVFASFTAALAGEQADRAIKAVLALKEAGKLGPAPSVSILAKEGNVQNIWGRNFEIKNLWEKLTGVKLDTRTRANLPVFDDMKKNRDFDLTLSRQREYPDLYINGLIADLTPFARKYGLNLSEGAHGGFLAPEVQSEFDERLVAIPADGDIALLFLRTDLMEDIATRSEFRHKYKRELNPPETWEEYLDLLAFFHNPGKEFYGSCEQRNPANGWMFWMPRYASQAAPHKYLFDDEMRPLINSQEGVRATESYVAAVEYSAPDILSEKSDYPYTVSTFRSGKAFSIIQTLALAKIANAESSPIRGKVKAVPMPGTMVNGKLIRRTSFIYGNNLVVSTGSKNPELAFLFAMWFTDPEISSLSIRMTTGLMDPYRGNHIEDPAVWEIYTKEAVSQLAAHSKIAVPEGTGLPGDSEYMKALSMNLWLAARKEITPKEAMAKTAAEWERITERYGRSKQKVYWKNFKTHYPK